MQYGVPLYMLAVQGMLSAIAPLVPHMAEDAWLSHPQSSSSSHPASVFLAGWAAPEQQWSSMSDDTLSCWAALPAVREACTKALELARRDKQLGSSLEASVSLHVSHPKVAAWLAELNAAGNAADELKYLFITSSVQLADSAEAAGAGALAVNAVDTGAEVAGVVTAAVHKAAGSKCARCWMYSTQVSWVHTLSGVLTVPSDERAVQQSLDSLCLSGTALLLAAHGTHLW